MRWKRVVLALSALMVVGLVLGPACEFCVAEEDPSLPKRPTGSAATNDSLMEYVDALVGGYEGGNRPAPPPKDASRDEFVAYKAAVAKFVKERDKFRRHAEKALLEMMTLCAVRHEVNIRDEVNTHAARVLGQLAPRMDATTRERLSKKIIRAIETRLTEVKTHTVSSDHLAAAFKTLAQLGEVRSLVWMSSTYIGTNQRSGAHVLAALQAMVGFKVDGPESVPGRIRHEIVARVVKAYADLPTLARASGIDAYAIRVLQHFARAPTDAAGRRLQEFSEFKDWLRQHDDPKQAPWADPK